MSSDPTRVTRPLRLIFFGTPEIAVPTLERLITGPHEVVAVVSQPDRPRGRGRKLSPSPVSAVALRENIPLLRPEKVGNPDCVAALEGFEADLGVVVAFGQFLPRKVREMPGCGYLINAHASLLPKYRGAAPIARAILDGESETGISVMRIEKEMDAGPVALVARTPIGPHENTAELSERLSELAASAIAQAVDTIARGEVEWTEQGPAGVTHAEKIDKRDAILDLRESARALSCRIHALSPKPGGTLRLIRGTADPAREPSQETELKVSRARALPFEDGTPPEPGTIEMVTAGRDTDSPRSQAGRDDAPLRIATGEGWLVPLVLQRPGGKALPIDDFLRGYEIDAAHARFAVLRPESAQA